MELEHEFDELVADRRAEIMDCLKWYYRYHDREHVTWQLSWQWPALFYDRCACGGAAASFYPLIFHYPDTSDDLADDPAEDQADDQAENPIDDPVILPLHAFWFVSWNYENCTLSYAGGDFAGTRLGGSSGHGGGMSGGPGGAGGLGLGGPGLLLDELLDLQPHPDPTPLPIPLPAPGLMFPAALVALGLLGWVRRRARIAS